MKTLLKSLQQWIVNTNATTTSPDADRIDWVRAVPFILINASCLLVFWVGWSWVACLTALSLYYVRLFAIGAFYHRYFSHKTFRTNRVWQFLFALIGSTSVQRGPIWWAAHHRQHHLVSDQPSDAHSPLQHGFWWSHAGWFLSRRHFQYDSNRVKDWLRYPELRFLDRYDVLLPGLLFVGLWIFGYILQTKFPQYHTTTGQMLVWGFGISTTALFHTTVIINSLSHIFGSKRFATGDNSRNNFLFALLTLGEGWHNNHHYYPASARQGFFWWELDVTYYIIKLFEKIHIVSDVKCIPKHVLNRPQVI